MKCIGPKCDREGVLTGNTLCRSHYAQIQRGSTLKELRHIDPKRRFWSQVRKTETCWLWAGRSLDGRGRYGHITVDGRSWPAHRLAYVWANGPVSDDLVMDHLCRTTLCVRPDHLEPVPQVENIMRGVAIQSFNARKLRCIRGHEFAPEAAGPAGRRCDECLQMPQMKARKAWQQRKRRAASAGIPFSDPEPPLPPALLTDYEATLPLPAAS